MTKIETAPVAERASRSRWLVVLAAFGTPAALLLSAALVLVATMNDHVLVSSRAGLRDVALGRPLSWIHQDQGSSDPPLPGHVGVLSPWEHPTTLAPDALLVDVLVVFAAVAVGAVVVTALAVGVVRRARSSR